MIFMVVIYLVVCHRVVLKEMFRFYYLDISFCFCYNIFAEKFILWFVLKNVSTRNSFVDMKLTELFSFAIMILSKSHMYFVYRKKDSINIAW